eukprot:scaffold80914_cov30-Tisochrysis_lutea.AAC.1
MEGGLAPPPLSRLPSGGGENHPPSTPLRCLLAGRGGRSSTLPRLSQRIGDRSHALALAGRQPIALTNALLPLGPPEAPRPAGARSEESQRGRGNRG